METNTREERRLFYFMRALELVDKGDYKSAVISALSDSMKLNKENGMFAFGQSMELSMYYENPDDYQHTILSIKRILDCMNISI